MPEATTAETGRLGGDERERRIEKLHALRQAGIDAYPARSNVTHSALQVVEAFTAAEANAGTAPNAAAEVAVVTAGRLTSIRVMGKASFAHLVDGTGKVQIYVRQDQVDEESYDRFLKLVDIGDFVRVEGTVFRTRTGEVTVRVGRWSLLTKTLRPLPEKWHGLTDVEVRYRQRYLDLLTNERARNTFIVRTRLVSAIRRYLDERGFLEVETPVLQPVYGGAAARPFVTFHNELGANLFLRISDELYLKRLIIGGLDRVYEIGHDFRNEGVSTRHNPEFTQLEVYQAYADYHDMMRLTEELYFAVANQVLGTGKVTFCGNEIDLTPPWRRISMRDAILDAAGIDIQAANTLPALREAMASHSLAVEPKPNWGKQVEELFDATVEPGLIQPTFILDYPVEISPLAKRRSDAPELVERFEFWIGGQESGNAFSELNDPIDQRSRFEDQGQQQTAGDEEAHPMDEDWIRALEHGMPPTGGLGFGIDRMAMLFTDNASIREVILFPPLRSRAVE
jgi:lysyl-tRNA synthetase class 2